MKLDLLFCFGLCLAVLFLGIVGAFLLYVPPLTVLTVATLLAGLGLMFVLGMQTGRRVRKISATAHRPSSIVENLSAVR